MKLGEKRFGVVIVGGLLIAALSGCMGGATSAGERSAEPFSTAASPNGAMEMPEPTTSGVPAVTALGGDCDAVLSPTERAAIDPALATSPSGTRTMSASPTGSLSCFWSTPPPTASEPFNWTTVSVYVVPDVEVLPEVRLRYAPTSTEACPSDRSTPCTIAQRVEDLWVAIETTAAPAEGHAIANTVWANVAAAASRYPTAAGATAGAGVWRDVTCDAIGRDVDMAALLGARVASPTFPGDHVPAGPAWEAETAAHASLWCPWTGSENGDAYSSDIRLVEVEVYPNRSVRVSTEYTPVAIAGADAAWTGPGAAEGSRRVLVQSGPNVLMVYGGLRDDTLVSVAEAVISALNMPGS